MHTAPTDPSYNDKRLIYIDEYIDEYIPMPFWVWLRESKRASTYTGIHVAPSVPRDMWQIWMEGSWYPDTKYQIPNTRYQIPNTKYPIPNSEVRTVRTNE